MSRRAVCEICRKDYISAAPRAVSRRDECPLCEAGVLVWLSRGLCSRTARDLVRAGFASPHGVRPWDEPTKARLSRAAGREVRALHAAAVAQFGLTAGDAGFLRRFAQRGWAITPPSCPSAHPAHAALIQNQDQNK